MPKKVKGLMMLSKYYVYRFLNNKGEVIYIGKTGSIKRRMEVEHFSESGHLPRECYMDTCNIEYAQFKSDNTMKIYEIYLISKHKPLYNQEFNYKQENMDLVLPDPIWMDYKITDNMRSSIKSMGREEALWIAKDKYDTETWYMCFAALGGGL